GRLVESYKNDGLSEQDARARAAASSPVYDDLALHGPPDQVTWLMLERLTRRDPALALERWEEVKQAAREELRSGASAGRAVVESGQSCWQRARFLAARAELTEAWRPRNAVEQNLVDQMAQAQVLLWRWQEALRDWSKIV